MSSCRKNRKPIAWLVMEALPQAEAAKLREHLRGCESCRRSYEELLRVTGDLKSMQILAEAPAPERGSDPVQVRHRMEALAPSRTERSWDAAGSAPRRALLVPALLRWRVALPVGCALGLALLSLSVLERRSSPAPPASSGANAVHAHQAPPAPTDLPPTIGNYHLIANQSLDDLDQLMTRQAKQTRAAPRAYTAAGLAAAPFGD